MAENEAVTDEKEKMKQQRARYRFLQVWTLVGAILLTGVLVYLLGILSVPVGIIVWTGIIVFCLRTPVNWLEKRRVPRSIGTMLAYVLMVIVLAGLGILLFSPVFGIGDQFRNLIESLPSYVQAMGDWYDSMYDQYSYFLQDQTVTAWIDQATNSLATWTSDIAKSSAQGIVDVGSSVANSFIAIGFALVVAFWILMELPAIGKECKRLIGPKREEDAQLLYITGTRVMGGYIKATLIQCLLIGIGCAVAYAIIGIPNYTALGAIAGLLNIIPVVGPWLGGAMAALVGVFINPWVALITLAVTIVIQQFVYTFVSPKVMGNSVDVHPALVFIALFAGSAIGGAMSGLLGSLVGMLASIPAVAAAKALFVYYFEKKSGRRIVDENGVFFKGTPSQPEGENVDPIGDVAPKYAVEKEEVQKEISQDESSHED